MNFFPDQLSSFATLALGCAALFLSGCAVHYYDAETGTENLWGFGHFRMKGPPKNGAQPVVTGSHMLGLNLRAGRDDYGVGIGFDSQSRITMPTSGTLLMEWPTNAGPLPRELRDLFTVRIGTNLPPGWEQPSGLSPTITKNKP